MEIWEIACALGLPSAIVGLGVWRLKKYLDKKEKAREEKDKRHEALLLTLVNGTDASLHLAEATAKAVARIPDARCNGDMHAALEYAQEKKHEMNDYLVNQGIQRIV